jgi:hypothetical protein
MVGVWREPLVLAARHSPAQYENPDHIENNASPKSMKRSFVIIPVWLREFVVIEVVIVVTG